MADTRRYDYENGLTGKYNQTKPILYSSNSPDAMVPKRVFESDATFPISIIARTKKRLEDVFQDVNEFTAEFSLAPPPGYFIEIVATQYLCTKGYMLAHTPFINPKDESSIIKVLLFKYKDVEDLQLPFPIGLVGKLCCANYSRISKRVRGVDEGDETRMDSIEAPKPTQHKRGFFY